WALIAGHGWVWVPGDEWAPAWVSWRESGDTIGWAPLPPETLAWHGRDWGTTVDVEFSISSSWFSFVLVRNFSSHIREYCLPYDRHHDYFRATRNITNIHWRNRDV